MESDDLRWVIPWMFWLGVFALIGGVSYCTHRDEQERAERSKREDVQRMQWFQAHKCYSKRIFAVGGLNTHVYHVFDCQGAEVLWEDIPVEDK